MHIGVDYYPEHWPRSRWPRDARLMRAAGFNVVRLAEFNWVNMEPAEGRFDFSLLDEVLPLLAKHGISTILCTPTAVAPAWAARNYPEIMAMESSGARKTWGVRKEYCFSSGAFRRLSENITRAMAAHFAGASNVIGWQTDNEFGHSVCHCESCRQSFRDWLRVKYRTLDALNRAWGTHFWGHRVQTWDEIQIPVSSGSYNPGACLDWQRHYSWQNVMFQRDQVRLLRQHCPKHFVTHNCMGLFPELDYYALAEDLDFVSWDNYPVWSAPGVRCDASLAADVMRGLKQQNFWIMEQTAGPCGWGTFGRNVWPGELRNVAYQQLAHGADGQVWFRWRTCTAGREQYWHGLLGHDGRPLRRYAEAARTAKEYHRLAPLLKGTTVAADVAIIYDYQSLWALRIQPCWNGHEYKQRIAKYYNALLRAGVNVDIVPPGADLARYKLVLAPCLYIMPDALAEQLDAYVRRGGVLLADCRTGIKDMDSLCHARTLPGKLGAALGIEIQEYETIPEGLNPAIAGTPTFPGTFTAEHYTDWVLPKSAKALAQFDHWHLDGYAALTRNRCGKGVGWYVGALVKEDAFYDQLAMALLKDARIKPLLQPPAGVEVSLRRNARVKLLFIINHTDEPKAVAVPADKQELLSGRKTSGPLRLPRFGVAVIKL